MQKWIQTLAFFNKWKNSFLQNVVYTKCKYFDLNGINHAINRNCKYFDLNDTNLLHVDPDPRNLT